MTVRIINADCLTALPQLAADGVRAHCVVTDPPYGLEFMGVAWDTFSDGPKGRARPRNEWNDFGSREHARNASEQAGIARKKNLSFQEFSAAWAREVYACMLPGAHLVAFGGTRTFHRMVCAIEDAGFEIRDTLMWVYGSGFPKSLNAERAVAMETCPLPGRHFGSSLPVPAKRLPGDHVCPATPQSEPWDGYGTALKPSYEPIILARKPLSEGNVAANVLRHGCGAINVDACRVPTDDNLNGGAYAEDASKSTRSGSMGGGILRSGIGSFAQPAGRWPANLLHDGSPEVEQAFAAFGTSQTGARSDRSKAAEVSGTNWLMNNHKSQEYTDTGSASRFFYTAKADATDRAGSRHPTVKPASLMRWLIQLVCPPGGLVLDPFAGSGSTGLAADQLGFDAILIERDPQYAADARWKITSDAPLFAEVAD